MDFFNYKERKLVILCITYPYNLQQKFQKFGKIENPEGKSDFQMFRLRLEMLTPLETGLDANSSPLKTGQQAQG